MTLTRLPSSLKLLLQLPLAFAAGAALAGPRGSSAQVAASGDNGTVTRLTGAMTLQCTATDAEDDGGRCVDAVLRYREGAPSQADGRPAPSSPEVIRAHCGFDGWNRRDDLRSFGQDGASGNRNFFFEVGMKRASTVTLPGQTAKLAVYEGGLPLTGDEKALHCAFCTEGCASGNGPQVWDANGRFDFAWGFRFPYSGPWITLGRDGGGKLYESIQFENDSPAPACVSYWPAARGQSARRQQCAAARKIHAFRLTDLSPGLDYEYVLTTSPVAEPGLHEVPARQSQVYKFRSLPASEPTSEGGWKVLVFSDIQDNGDEVDSRFLFDALGTASQRPASDPVYQAAGAHFAIIPGDIVFNDEPGLWWTFFDRFAALGSSLPLLPSVGNHDTPGVGSSLDNSSFRRYFDLAYASPDAAFYSFAHDNLYIVGMDSERPAEFVPGTGAQHVWLKQQLERRRAAFGRRPSLSASKQWTFTHWHIPYFNAGARHSGRSPEFRAISELFAGVVDWHISGHEHFYQRSLPLVLRPGGGTFAAQRYGLAPGQGTGFLVMPPGGGYPGLDLLSPSDSPLRSLLAYPQTADRPPSEGGFVLLNLQGSTFRLRAFGTGVPGRRVAPYVRDEVSYDKSAASR